MRRTLLPEGTPGGDPTAICDATAAAGNPCHALCTDHPAHYFVIEERAETVVGHG